MIRLEMKNYNTILIEWQLIYQPYHQTKLITGEEILPSNKQRITEKLNLHILPWVKLLKNK